MVENSLQSLLDKYPYFLNKNEGSNFYKVVDVNNENFKDLYNSLFQVYESFHLRKKLLIWKEQSRPYDYSINFACYYPRIKSVTITKNDNLIYTNTYTKDENKSDFQFTYTCEYTITNSYRVIAYKCQECDEIYFSRDTVRECSHCHSHNIEQTRIYKCDNCDEVYFTNDAPSDCDNCNQNQFTEVNAYNCNVCGEIYFSTTLLQECPNCQTPYITKPSGTMYYDDPYINLNDNSMVITDNIEVEPLDNTSYVPTPQPPEEENESFPDPADGVEQTPENPYRVPIPIIPDDLFLITVETYDEYIVSKGFPENDKPTYDGKGRLTGDPFDHDYSLDEFGALNQIPRKEYIEVYNPELYNLTEPPFNNRLTEDDYHYMNRILEYNVRMWDTPAPVLEIWKLYGLPATLLNRERLLLKMFDETGQQSYLDVAETLVEEWKSGVVDWTDAERKKLIQFYDYLGKNNENAIQYNALLNTAIASGKCFDIVSAYNDIINCYIKEKQYELGYSYLKEMIVTVDFKETLQIRLFASVLEESFEIICALDTPPFDLWKWAKKYLLNMEKQKMFGNLYKKAIAAAKRCGYPIATELENEYITWKNTMGITRC